MNVIRPSRLTRFAVGAGGVILVATTAFLILRYPSLPDLLPVHFNRAGLANGWQFKSPARVLMPAFVQAAIYVCLIAVASLLLSRSTPKYDPAAPDVRAAIAAAETVVLIALIWVAFQAYAAWALVRLWTRGHGRLGSPYGVLALAGLVMTGVVTARGQADAGRPAARPDVPEHWRLRQLYLNAADPALFVPTREGRRWTLNFGRPVAVALLGAILLAGAIAPTTILILLLRLDF